LVRKPERKRPHGRHRHAWDDTMKMDLQEVEWGGAWTGLIWLKTWIGGAYL